jgi:hypothetical protein
MASAAHRLRITALSNYSQWYKECTGNRVREMNQLSLNYHGAL